MTKTNAAQPAEIADQLLLLLAPTARLLVIASSDKAARLEVFRLAKRARDIIDTALEADAITWDEMRALEAVHVSPVEAALKAKTPRSTSAQVKAAYAPKGPTWKQRGRRER